MLHKRCDIKTLLDEAIKRERLVKAEHDTTNPDDEEAYLRASHYEEAFQEVRDAIFDEYLPE